MALSSRLDSPVALLRKLERESYRAFHARSQIAKSDHFFNFCVTASSMRDYCLEHLGKVANADKQPLHTTWSQVPALVAAAEIANSSKHFVLRDARTRAVVVPKTRTVRTKLAQFVDVYEDSEGKTVLVPSTRKEVSVTLSDGQRMELHAFAATVINYWRKYLQSLGFQVRRQPLKHLAAQ